MRSLTPAQRRALEAVSRHAPIHHLDLAHEHGIDYRTQYEVFDLGLVSRAQRGLGFVLILTPSGRAALEAKDGGK